MSEDRGRRASASVEVEGYVSETFDEVEHGSALIDVQVTERFSGDIEGHGVLRFLQVAREDGHATFMGVERVRGSVDGRRGTFLLQVSGTIVGGDMHAKWFVIRGSGTGDLGGLCGDGGFNMKVGERGSIWLDYSLE